MNAAFLCLTSGTSNSAMPDSFRDMVFELRYRNDIFFVFGSRLYPEGDHMVACENFLEVEYGKSLKGVLSLLSGFLKIRKFVRANNIDTLFIWTSPFIKSVLSWFMPSGLKLAVWQHDPLTHSGERLSVRVLKYLDELALSLSRKSVCLLVASGFLKESINQTVLAERPVSVIPMPYIGGLVGEGFDIDSRKLKGTVLFFGRVEPYKGLDWLAEALIAHKDRLLGKGFKFIFVGKGNMPESFSILQSLGYDLRVLNYYVSNPDLRKLILDSEIAIFPYRDATGTQAIQSAGALGCKVLASDVGGLPDSVLKDAGGTIFDHKSSQDFVDKLIESMSVPLDPVEISGKYANVYSPRAFCGKLLRELEKIAGVK